MGGRPPHATDASRPPIAQNGLFQQALKAWRWSIEALFRASKQVLEIEAPQHWSRSSAEKVAPWVWSLQSVVLVWYFTAGQGLPEAAELRGVMGEWDSEWSLRQMVAQGNRE